MSPNTTPHLQLARQIADLFAALPQVESIALSGSRGSEIGTSDSASILPLNAADISDLPARVARLLDHLDQMLETEGFGRKVSA
jgi:hypothetical protein